MLSPRFLFSVICISGLLLTSAPSSARVSVSTGGLSDGARVNSAAGPKGINRLVLSKSKGGSIKDARARSKFTSKRVFHGNRVVARNNIAGDAQGTHVDANSVFVGVATFKANTPGATVTDFTIDVVVDGSLRCKTPDPAVPVGNCIAGVAVDIIVDGDSVFAGTALQDGAGPFQSSGAFSGAFTTEPNVGRIRNRKFPINLGTLTDGQKVQFFFVGSTLVSFAPDVPISFARADFFRTSSFKAAPKQEGKITLSAASKSVDVAYVSVQGMPPENVLFIESADTSVINDIKADSVKVVVPTVGYFPGVPSVFDAVPDAPADIDNDSVPDVRLRIDFPSIDTYLVGSNTIIVYGLTNAGEAFTGTLVRTVP
jgi:hypothetical protein